MTGRTIAPGNTFRCFGAITEATNVSSFIIRDPREYPTISLGQKSYNPVPVISLLMIVDSIVYNKAAFARTGIDSPPK